MFRTLRTSEKLDVQHASEDIFKYKHTQSHCRSSHMQLTFVLNEMFDATKALLTIHPNDE